MEYHSWYYAMKTKFKEAGFSRPVPAGDVHFERVAYAFYQAEKDNCKDLALCTYLADKKIWMYYWGDQEPFPGRMPQPGARVVLPEIARDEKGHAAKDDEQGKRDGYTSPGTPRLGGSRTVPQDSSQRSGSHSISGFLVPNEGSPVIAQPVARTQVSPLPQLIQEQPAKKIPQGYCLVQAHFRRLPSTIIPLATGQESIQQPSDALVMKVNPSASPALLPPKDAVLPHKHPANVQPNLRLEKEYIIIEDSDDEPKVSSKKTKKNNNNKEEKQKSQSTTNARQNADLTKKNPPFLSLNWARANNRLTEIEKRLGGDLPMFGWNLQFGEPWMAVKFQANNFKLAYSKDALSKLNIALSKHNLKLQALGFTWHVLAWPEFIRKECAQFPQNLERLSELRGMLEEEAEVKGAAKPIDEVWDNYKFRAPLSKRKPLLPRGLQI